MPKTKQRTELILSGIIAVGCGVLLRTAYEGAASFRGKGIGPMAFPTVILYLLLALCIVRFVLSLRYLVMNRREKASDAKTDPRVWATYLLIVGYALLWNVLGFSIATFVYIVAQAFVLKRDVSVPKTLLLALAVAAVMYLVFRRLFYVRFPEPLLGGILG